MDSTMTNEEEDDGIGFVASATDRFLRQTEALFELRTRTYIADPELQVPGNAALVNIILPTYIAITAMNYCDHVLRYWFCLWQTWLPRRWGTPTLSNILRAFQELLLEAGVTNYDKSFTVIQQARRHIRNAVAHEFEATIHHQQSQDLWGFVIPTVEACIFICVTAPDELRWYSTPDWLASALQKFERQE
jgi:hypothetical protein